MRTIAWPAHPPSACYCRQNGLKPEKGEVYEDVGASSRSQDASSSRPRRETRQPEFYGRDAAAAFAELDDGSHDSDEYAAHSSRRSHQASRQRSSGYYAERNVRQRSSYQVVNESNEDEEAEAAAPGGSLSTAYDTDGDFDEDDAPASAPPLGPLSRSTSTARTEHQPVVSQARALLPISQALFAASAEPAAVHASVQTAVALPPVPAAESVLPASAATLPDTAVPSSIAGTSQAKLAAETVAQPFAAAMLPQAGPAQGPPLSPPSQGGASAPQSRTVLELVAAVNADMSSADAIQPVQMKVFSRLKDLVKLEDDDRIHPAMDVLQDVAELTQYQALKMRQHYLKLEPPFE